MFIGDQDEGQGVQPPNRGMLKTSSSYKWL